MLSTGIVFGTTGGEKILRAIRSLRRTEPDVSIYVVADTSSKTWVHGGHKVLPELKCMPFVQIREIFNGYHINGTLNAGMQWMKELGYDYCCLFHDDIIFTPFPEHMHHITRWFDHLYLDAAMLNASALTLSLMETGITGPDGDLFTGNAPDREWDQCDLESEQVWQKLLPNMEVPGGFRDGKGVYEVADAFRLGDKPVALRYYYGDLDNYTRLGPTGQIVPIKIWEEIGGFDEKYGIHYDAYYPAEVVLKGGRPTKVIANIPHLHLHNQSIGYLDPSTGLWGNVSAAFASRYGNEFWNNKLKGKAAG